MIDKLDLLVKTERDLRPEFWSLLRGCGRVRRPREVLYLRTYDLRELDVGLLVHLGRTETGPIIKLEATDVGRLTVGQVVTDFTRVLRDDPMDRSLTRVDLAADVPDVPVQWFRDNARVRYKRVVTEFGERSSWGRFRSSSTEGLHYGRRPNLYRVYDRVAASRQEYRREMRSISVEQRPTFSETYGFDVDDVITRVERQLGGQPLRTQFPSFGALIENALKYDPFSRMDFSINALKESHWETLTPSQRLKVAGALYFLHGRSWHELRAWLDRGNRNGARQLDKLRGLLGAGDTLVPPDLRQLYRQSVARQLGDDGANRPHSLLAMNMRDSDAPTQCQHRSCGSWTTTIPDCHT